jgi:hypothetical protein
MVAGTNIPVRFREDLDTGTLVWQCIEDTLEIVLETPYQHCSCSYNVGMESPIQSQVYLQYIYNLQSKQIRIHGLP